MWDWINGRGQQGTPMALRLATAEEIAGARPWIMPAPVVAVDVENVETVAAGTIERMLGRDASAHTTQMPQTAPATTWKHPEIPRGGNFFSFVRVDANGKLSLMTIPEPTNRQLVQAFQKWKETADYKTETANGRVLLFMDFQSNWRVKPNMRSYVEAEIARCAG